MKNCPKLRDVTNLGYQLLELEQKLEANPEDVERFKLRVAYQKKHIKWVVAVKELEEKFKNII